jgi:hypothetical protein
MISMEIYQMLHLIAVVLTLCCSGIALHGNKDKIFKIVGGIRSLFILITGFGFLARLGLDGFPLYIKIKIAIWLILVMGTPIITKRCPQFGRKFFWIVMSLFACVAYLVSFKPI